MGSTSIVTDVGTPCCQIWRAIYGSNWENNSQSKKERSSKKLFTNRRSILYYVGYNYRVFFAPYASLALVVPFFILLNLRLRMSKNSYVKDVSINIEQDDIWRILTISHSVYRKNVLCSCRYLVPKHENIRTYFDTSNEQLEIIFKSKVIYLLNETILETDETIKKRRVQLFCPKIMRYPCQKSSYPILT